MAIHLRDLPIKRKLMLVILLTSSFALLLMGSALITYELITFRRTLAAGMGVLANIVGSNSTAALAFQDRKNAQEILGALSAEPQITAAAIYDEAGQIFARFPADLALEELPAQPEADGHRFTQAHLFLFRPITFEGARLGTIFLQADLGAMYPLLRLWDVAAAGRRVLLSRRAGIVRHAATTHLESGARTGGSGEGCLGTS